ncbi:DUF4190 domain-containing protein [Streptomyces sp. NPDC048111]|uniref:DUF4190 domain-containing protein n=1 Tax=Streptomyces sp. NPDC048111 TaxID=3365500 RepID=UPI00372137BD
MVDVGEEVWAEPENRAAAIGIIAALLAAVVASGGMLTAPVSLYTPATLGWFVLMELSAWTAILAGHVARRRAKRHSLPGRWWALVCVLTGWVCSLYAGLVTLVSLGEFALLFSVFH